MAKLRNHKGIEQIYKVAGIRYAVCKDGNVLESRGYGWKLTKATPEQVIKICQIDDSPQAKAIITRTNHDADLYERAKRWRWLNIRSRKTAH